MPPTPVTTYHVLLTGYGPFSYVTDNPSWRAVAPLNRTTIHTNSATIHVSVFGPVLVTYTAVLALVQGVHARPPQLPASVLTDPPAHGPPPPPPGGYDFVLHLGAGRPGALSLEEVGHKSGYREPGVDGRLPPFVPDAEVGVDAATPNLSESERYEAERLRAGREDAREGGRVPAEEGAAGPESESEPLRGFGRGYEYFPETLHTEVDVQGLLAHLKAQGENRVVASTDAGHYLCDFLCYGSLAESQRALYASEAAEAEAKRSKALFVHVPHQEHQPHSIAEMTEAVRQIVAWVCAGEAALPAL